MAAADRVTSWVCVQTVQSALQRSFGGVELAEGFGRGLRLGRERLRRHRCTSRSFPGTRCSSSTTSRRPRSLARSQFMTLITRFAEGGTERRRAAREGRRKGHNGRGLLAPTIVLCVGLWGD